jgi:hypothetical protein
MCRELSSAAALSNKLQALRDITGTMGYPECSGKECIALVEKRLGFELQEDDRQQILCFRILMC